MSTQDIIKKSVLEGFSTDISVSQIIAVLGVTLLIALYIYIIYRLCSNSNFYSKDFNKTLAVIPIITAAIVLAIQSNLVISLGMVGALSIVRFRNAVKNPLDLLFLFWAISVGIICGAGLFSVAVIMSLAVTILVFLLDLIKAPNAPYLLVVQSENKDIELQLKDILREYGKGSKVKSRNITMNGTNLVIELRTKKEQQLLDKCSELSGITAVSLLSHDGEVRL